MITTKRIAIAGLTVAAILLLLALKVVIFGTAAPPYAHLEAKVESSINEYRAQLMKKYNVTKMADLPKVVPDDVLQEAWEKQKKEINALYATVTPPSIEIDASCRDQVSDITVSPPEMDAMIFGRYFTVPVKVKAKTAFTNRYSTGLIVKTYAKDGAVVEDSDLHLSTEASPGDLVSGKFTLTGAETALAKAYRFKVLKKEKK
jgi:hypothetical protein